MHTCGYNYNMKLRLRQILKWFQTVYIGGGEGVERGGKKRASVEKERKPFTLFWLGFQSSADK